MSNFMRINGFAEGRVYRWLNEAAFEALENAGGRQLSPAVRRRLDEAISGYLAAGKYMEIGAMTSLKEVDAFAKSGKLAARAARALARRTPAAAAIVQGASRSELMRRAQGTGLQRESFLDDLAAERQLLPRLADLLDGLVANANALLNYLEKGPTGQPRPKLKGKKLHQDSLARELSSTFQAAGGRASVNGAGTGPFVRFLRTFHACMPRGTRPVTADALVKAARNACKKRTRLRTGSSSK